MRRAATALVAAAMMAGGVVACSDEQQLADVCKVADLALVTKWYGAGYADDGTTRNDCRYGSTTLGSVHISAERLGSGPTVTVQFQFADSAAAFDDELLATYLTVRAFGTARDGVTIEERVTGLRRLPDLASPCSTAFHAGNSEAMVSLHVSDRDGVRTFGPVSAVFGSGLPSTSCSDLEGENHSGTVDERWPATYTDAVLDAPAGTECGPATLHLTGVQVYPPDGTTVDLGDITMTNSNWMIEPPMECRRT